MGPRRSPWWATLATALVTAGGSAVATYYGSGAAGGINANEHRLTALETRLDDLGREVQEHKSDDIRGAANLWFAVNHNRTEAILAKP